MGKNKVILAIDLYLNNHYTWIFNQLKYFKNTEAVVFARKLDPDHEKLGLNVRDVFSLSDFEMNKNVSYLKKLFYKVKRFIFQKTFVKDVFFARKIRNKKAALLHAHFGNMGYEYLDAAKKAGVPVITSFYGYDYELLPNRQPVWRGRYEKLFKEGALFLTEGEHGKKILVSKGAAPEKVKVHHLGVDVAGIPFKTRSLEDGEPLRLIQVASFVEKKGHKTLIEALKVLKDRGLSEKVRLTLAGDGPLKEEISGMISGYGLEKNVIMKGYMPYERLYDELLRNHVFVHPSLKAPDGDCEGGAPVVLLDAQASGMPVVSTFHCDIPEEVLDGETGILVREGDHAALADAVMKFYENPGLLGRYGAAGRKHVEKDYSAVVQAERLEGLYAELAGYRPSG